MDMVSLKPTKEKRFNLQSFFLLHMKPCSPHSITAAMHSWLGHWPLTQGPGTTAQDPGEILVID